MGSDARARAAVVRVAAAVALLLCAARASAIPVFARIYGKPCSACHTVYPQLNPAGEAFRAHGLHGLKPVIQPIAIAPWLDLPGTLPTALSFSFGETVTYNSFPGVPDKTVSHFNFDFLALLFGGELGPHFAFMADYAPIFTIPQTGEVQTNTRPGIAFLQGHAEPWDTLANGYLGLFELPLGQSPRVHRLTVRPYLIYNITAFGLLAVQPPVMNRRTDSMVLSSAQIGGEAMWLEPESGLQIATGVVTGSNNRVDNNESADVFVRVGQELPDRRAGLFFYYAPDTLSAGAYDQIIRVGPDFMFTSRRTRLALQFLAGWDSNPTGQHDDLWYYGGFAEGNFRFTTDLIGIMRLDAVGMAPFDDRSAGGSVDVDRTIWEVTTGLQYLIEENLKLVAEVTYAENHESVTDATARGVSATLRLATAFWPLTPPILSRWLGEDAPRATAE